MTKPSLALSVSSGIGMAYDFTTSIDDGLPQKLQFSLKGGLEASVVDSFGVYAYGQGLAQISLEPSDRIGIRRKDPMFGGGGGIAAVPRFGNLELKFDVAGFVVKALDSNLIDGGAEYVMTQFGVEFGYHSGKEAIGVFGAFQFFFPLNDRGNVPNSTFALGQGNAHEMLSVGLRFTWDIWQSTTEGTVPRSRNSASPSSLSFHNEDSGINAENIIAEEGVAKEEPKKYTLQGECPWDSQPPPPDDLKKIMEEEEKKPKDQRDKNLRLQIYCCFDISDREAWGKLRPYWKWSLEPMTGCEPQ